MRKILLLLALVASFASAQVTTSPSVSGVPAPQSAVAITGGTISGTTITTSTYNGNTLTTGSSTYTGTAAQTYTFPTTSATIARTDAAQTFTGTQTITGVASVSSTFNVGSASTLTDRGLSIVNNNLTDTTQYGAVSQIVSTSGATAGVTAYYGGANTSANSYTTNLRVQFHAVPPTKGAGSTITDDRGFSVNDTSQGTSNYGFYSALTSGSGKWAFYGSSTAQSAFGGNVRIGSTTAPTVALDVTGNVAVSGTITAAAIASSGAAQSGYLCYNTTGGVITYDGGATCLVSLEEYKDKSGGITGADALRDVLALRPFWGKYKDNTPMHDHRQQPFFGAHQVESVDPRLAAYTEAGELHGVRYANITAVLAAAIQEQQRQINRLKRELKSLSHRSKS